MQSFEDVGGVSGETFSVLWSCEDFGRGAAFADWFWCAGCWWGGGCVFIDLVK